MKLLVINNLSVHYGGALVLNKVRLRVEEGSSIGILGLNGAGKTTLLMTIINIETPSSGEIMFMEERIDNFKPYEIVRRGIALCPQGRRVFAELSVERNLMLGAYLRRDKKEIGKNLEGVYNTFPVLKERRKQLAGTLSGGEQQMLAIGRSLMCKPKLLLLDEPTLGLAPIIKDRILESIKEIKRSGLTLLLAEQDVSFAFKIVDRAYVLESGNMVMSGTIEELTKDTRIRKTYFGL